MAASIIIIISSNSWLICWIALEFNLLFFIPLLLLKKNNKYQAETAFKYFITQALASLVILLRVYIIKRLSTNLATMSIIRAIILKIAAAPFHQWLPALRLGLEWDNLFVILIPQKINPFLLLAQINLDKLVISLIILFITARALLGRVSGLRQTSLKKILIYSSISHLRWLIAALLLDNYIWISYLFIYGLILLTLVLNLKKNNTNTISKITNLKKTNSLFISLRLLCLGGLPPFRGFLIKFIILAELRNSPQNLLIAPLLLSSVLNLFFYIRVRVPNIFITRKKNKITKTSFNNKSIIIINLVTLFCGWPLLILDFKLYKLKAFKALKKVGP